MPSLYGKEAQDSAGIAGMNRLLQIFMKVLTEAAENISIPKSVFREYAQG
jgi:hypothetical protein